MARDIAIVGMACCYPDARSPVDLWTNILAGRQSFRRMPDERLRLDDYFSAERTRPDTTYSSKASLITDYEFDRSRFRVAASTYRSADLTHWLALDVASQALADAGFPEGEGLPRESTGVILGNTLTGEFSRSYMMRLRWPFVRRSVAAVMAERGASADERRELIERLESVYKAPFPAVTEETLAGGLANTIAGRICNYFDLQGGGYTVDGACASSLLSIISVCNALTNHDLDVGLAGGVDLSLDPFELLGFAKVGALAAEEMRVYDARSAGFWPGEGCGIVTLMREQDAVAQGRRVYAVIRGWGMSSDGHGGITRPEVGGQRLAIQRAYRAAGFGIETVELFEGHGTGTAVGDATELKALIAARAQASSSAPPAAVGSIKANIGHTKAAAGVAGLIKAAMAIRNQILPPHVGSENPHPDLRANGASLRIVREGEVWPVNRPLRAGVSAMGFGGINTHVVLESVSGKNQRRRVMEHRERVLVSTRRNCELFLLVAAGREQLEQKIVQLLAYAFRLSRAELTDLAVELSRTVGAEHGARAAVVASTPEELAARLALLLGWLREGRRSQIEVQGGAFLGVAGSPPRVGFLFTGQGAPVRRDGGVWRTAFESVRELYEHTELPDAVDATSTEVAQPSIVTCSMAALRILEYAGVRADIAVGHSLGELTALCWAGVMEESELLSIATVRGRAMAQLGGATGAMASIRAGVEQTTALIAGSAVTIACMNSPVQTVISGERDAVQEVVERARNAKVGAVLLPVTRAFHSPLVQAAIPVLQSHVAAMTFCAPRRAVASTVTGTILGEQNDVHSLLANQVVAPVRFTEALAAAADGIDLWLEVGPGRTLTDLVSESLKTPAVALDSCGSSMQGLCAAIGALFAMGAAVDTGVLFAGRFSRPLALDWGPRFFVNPCELAPVLEESSSAIPTSAAPVVELESPAPASAAPVVLAPENVSAATALDLIRSLVARKLELPSGEIKDQDRFLSDLHMNSITVAQITSEAFARLGRRNAVVSTEFADSSLAELAAVIAEQPTADASSDAPDPLIPGVDRWTRAFTIHHVRRPKPTAAANPRPASIWQVLAPPGHPLVDGLPRALEGVGTGGVAVCLPPDATEAQIPLLLQGVRAVLAHQGPATFVLLQRGRGAAALARSLHMEARSIRVCVIDAPFNDPRALQWITDEVTGVTSYSEAFYDESGERFEPVMKLLAGAPPSSEPPLGASDVLLVTGGGKGITAECALSLARKFGVRLLLLGRSDPTTDVELARNLGRMAALNVPFRYLRADVTEAGAVKNAVSDGVAALGPVTAVLHGAASNVPRAAAALDEAAFREALAPKIDGLDHVLAAVDPTRLRLLVAFGSIIARAGLHGEAHYGLANEWLTHLTGQVRARLPSCRCLSIAWSVWAGTGMGERLGTLEALTRSGIMPIPLEDGIAMLEHLLVRSDHDSLPVEILVTGRHGESPVLRTEESPLPLYRFLESPRVRYRGVELIADAEISAETDLYLHDHVYRGERIFPGVMGMEAMAQAAMALAETREVPVLEDVAFNRPIIVPAGGSLTLRIAALARRPGEVAVAIRSSQTGFSVNHFEATCRFEGNRLAMPEDREAPAELLPIALQPQDLYGPILFHTGRFCRLLDYRLLRARECRAEIRAEGSAEWFNRYLPSELVLGDPGARDASIHVNQACVPHATLLPVRIRRLRPQAWGANKGPYRVHTIERTRDASTFTYDVEIRSASGELLERCEGLTLSSVTGGSFDGPWPVPLLGPYLEHKLFNLVPAAPVAIVFESGAALDRAQRAEIALSRALGRATTVMHRPDGKPEVIGVGAVSVSHTSDLTMVVTGGGALACDIEPVTPHLESTWNEMLSGDAVRVAHELSHEAGEDLNLSFTRVWTAFECLRKVGAGIESPLTIVSIEPGGFHILSSGEYTLISTFASLRDAKEPLAITILVKEKAYGHP